MSRRLLVAFVVIAMTLSLVPTGGDVANPMAEIERKIVACVED